MKVSSWVSSSLLFSPFLSSLLAFVCSPLHVRHNLTSHHPNMQPLEIHVDNSSLCQVPLHHSAACPTSTHLWAGVPFIIYCFEVASFSFPLKLTFYLQMHITLRGDSNFYWSHSQSCVQHFHFIEIGSLTIFKHQEKLFCLLFRGC